jgi:hypothetical protein
MRGDRRDASFETRIPDTNAVNVVLCALPTTFSAALSAQAEKAGCRVVGRCKEDATELRATIDARRANLLALVDYDPRHRFGQGLTYVSSPLPMPDGALETTVIMYDKPDPSLAQLLDRSAAPAPADSKP